MEIRVPRAAIEPLRSLIEEHLRQVYAWPGGESFADTDLDEWDFVEFLYAALEYVRDAHPWMGRRGAVLDAVEHVRDLANIDLFKALLDREPRTPEAVIAAMADVVPFEIIDEPCGRRAAKPRLYKHFPHDLPKALYGLPEAPESISWYEHVFGVVERAGWLLDRDQRSKVFAAIHPYYEQLSFTEIDSKAAHRLACALFAGPARRSTLADHDQEATALLSLLGPGSRFFSNRAFDEDELRDPFAHGESVDLGTIDSCAGGSLLALLISDGRYLVQLDALWDTWSE